ncbi:hypothetical protein SAMN05216276_102936 [Streptosporangium subroseum]|uniref:Uncharacterized protein n=1 Tax=Streptosporangium subroseum TaxID=106412 RepID=A0A239KXV0_9ACTN|nr:hypothetical protein SAMN05216276_102936 [Streptosporangium subroseum]
MSVPIRPALPAWLVNIQKTDVPHGHRSTVRDIGGQKERLSLPSGEVHGKDISGGALQGDGSATVSARSRCTGFFPVP